jgi:hypothetical protein
MAELTEDAKFRRLRKFNGAMSIIHLLQGVLILILANSFSTPIYSFFLKFDPATNTLLPDPQVLFNVPIAPLIALFLFISAFDHFLLSVPLNKWYVEGLKQKHNYARWYEYAASSSVMIVIVCLLVGIYDVAALIAIFAINSLMNLLGLLMERYNWKSEKTDWTPFIYGTYAGMIPWVCIAIYLGGAGASGQVPSFVYGIFVVIAIFFFSFAFNMILQYKRVGRWNDYLFGEYVYIVLSLVAKTALAWQVFFGTLRPM